MTVKRADHAYGGGDDDEGAGAGASAADMDTSAAPRPREEGKLRIKKEGSGTAGTRAWCSTRTGGRWLRGRRWGPRGGGGFRGAPGAALAAAAKAHYDR